jgi:sugar/nucleoside kinase (ribokinase family)
VRFVDAVPGHPTLLSVCFQYPDGSGGNFTTTDSAAALVSEREVDAVERWLSPAAIALAAPEVPLAIRRHLLRRATERGALRVASLILADVEEAQATGLLDQVDLLAVNEDEAGALAGEPFPEGPPSGFLDRLGRRLRARQPSLRLLVTAGARGAFALDGEAWSSAPALPVHVVSSAGAGDAFLGGALAGLAAGLPLVAGRNQASRSDGAVSEIASALDLGALVAAFKVTSPHTIPPDLSLDALLAFAAAQHVAFGQAFRALLPETKEERHGS